MQARVRKSVTDRAGARVRVRGGGVRLGRAVLRAQLGERRLHLARVRARARVTGLGLGLGLGIGLQG